MWRAGSACLPRMFYSLSYGSGPPRTGKTVVGVLSTPGVRLSSGTLVSPASAPYPGRIGVLIEITDPAFEQYRTKVPGGAYAQAAIYSTHFRHVAVLRKVLLRMSAWMNYLFPFH